MADAQIDYRAIIEHWFFIKNKQGILLPFKFNDVQNLVYNDMVKDYGIELEGVRENWVKGRQFGLSSMVTGIVAAKFICSETGALPIVDMDTYSHKDKETEAHIARFNLFINSYLIKSQGGTIDDMENIKTIDALRRQFLDTDNGGHIKSAKRGAQFQADTASAKVSGRGGTKQVLHWTEPAFYPNTDIMNAKTLMVGTEKQVPDGYGMIIRESTGRSKGDYFASEYYKAKEGRGAFKSRFIAWYLYKEYSTPAPANWELPEYYEVLIADDKATRDQCYWHWNKTDRLEDKEELREYPTYDYEAFIAGGKPFFSQDALVHYESRVKPPIKEALYVSAL